MLDYKEVDEYKLMVREELMRLRAKREAWELFQKEEVERERLAKEEEQKNALDSVESNTNWVIDVLKETHKDRPEIFDLYLTRATKLVNKFRSKARYHPITEGELLDRAGVTRLPSAQSQTNTQTLRSEDDDAQ